MDAYLGDRKQQQMLIRKKFQKDNDRTNTSTHVKGKNDKNPIDLPQIKIYKGKDSSYLESAQYFNRKKYNSPREKT